MPVGSPIEVHHLTYHDMAEHQCDGAMTAAVLLRGLKANAVERLGSRRLNRHNGITTIQPRWVEELEAPSEAA